MDKRIAKPWSVGITHVLTSYVAAGMLTFVAVFVIATFSLLLSENSESKQEVKNAFSHLIFPLYQTA